MTAFIVFDWHAVTGLKNILMNSSTYAAMELLIFFLLLSSFKLVNVIFLCWDSCVWHLYTLYLDIYFYVTVYPRLAWMIVIVYVQVFGTKVAPSIQGCWCEAWQVCFNLQCMILPLYISLPKQITVVSYG